MLSDVIFLQSGYIYGAVKGNNDAEDSNYIAMSLYGAVNITSSIFLTKFRKEEIWGHMAGSHSP